MVKSMRDKTVGTGKRYITLALAAIMVLSLVSCGKVPHESITPDYTKEIQELSVEVDVQKYKIEFQSFLCRDEQTEYTLLTDSLLGSMNVYEEDPSAVVEEPESSIPDEFQDGSILDAEDTGLEDYPIIDSKGNIVMYGTKSDSEASYRYYEAQPMYTVESVTVFQNLAIFKVWDKALTK